MTTPATRRVALFLLGYLLTLLAASVPKSMAPKPLADLVWGGMSSIALLALTHTMLRFDTRTWRDIGLNVDRRTMLRLMAGVGIGLAVYALTLAVDSLALGPITFSSPTWPSASTWLRVIASFLALSSMEELGFRGYALRTLADAHGPRVAQVVVAVAFALSHALFGWSWQPILLGVFPSALLFGAIALRSGGLAMPVGVHAALNLAQWMVSAKSEPGVWTLDVAAASAVRMQLYAPYVGLMVTLLAALVVATWPPRASADLAVNAVG